MPLDDSSPAVMSSNDNGQSDSQNSVSSEVLALVSLPRDNWDCTSKWEIKRNIQYNGVDVETDLLHAMKIDKQFVTWEDLFKLDTVKYILPSTGDDIPPDEAEYMNILRQDLSINVPEWGSGSEEPGCTSGNAFAGYHSGPGYKQKPIIDNIYQLRPHLVNKLNAKSLQRRIPNVERFLETLVKFLAIQQNALQGAYEDLFTSFCDLVGLHLSKGSDLRDQKMLVFGHEITSKPDLRAFHKFWYGPYGAASLPQIKTLLVVQVKPTVPSKAKTDRARKDGTRSNPDSTPDSASGSYDKSRDNAYVHLEPHVGQMFGEMLAELPNNKHDGLSMFGICLQGSRVQLLFLKANASLMEYIESDGSMEQLQEKQHCTRGTLYFTEPKDFMLHEERKDILTGLRIFGRESGLG